MKVNWGFEKDIGLHVWGSATFNYSCLSRSMGILHPQTPASPNEKGLLVGLGTMWAAFLKPGWQRP